MAGISGRTTGPIRSWDLHREILSAHPDVPCHLYVGKFWGGTDQTIVGYGVTDYTNRSGNDVKWFILGLADQKNYASLYVNAVKDGRYLLAEYADRLGASKVGSAVARLQGSVGGGLGSTCGDDHRSFSVCVRIHQVDDVGHV